MLAWTWTPAARGLEPAHNQADRRAADKQRHDRERGKPEGLRQEPAGDAPRLDRRAQIDESWRRPFVELNVG